MAYNPCGVNTTSTMLERELLTWVYRRGERVLGRAVFAAKCSLITRYPTNDNYYGPAYLWTFFGDPALRVRYSPLTGIAEPTPPQAAAAARPVLANATLALTEPAAWLFDCTGRPVLRLRQGKNDVRFLGRGVFFLDDGAKVVLF